MRKKIIAGNWKMFKTRDDALEFAYKVNNNLPSVDLVDSVICAPFTVLRDLVKRQGDNLRIGAQNMHFEENGAFTGEIAPVMLTSLGVTYVIIGHSERRALFAETDATVNKKLHAAINHHLIPILCVGEYLKEREDGSWQDVVKNQIVKDLEGFDPEVVKDIVIAYEPIWAIGTGKTATPEIADDACGFIRKTIKVLFGEETSEAIRIQYGGSVKTSNIDDLMAQPNIDGALVGGASLNAEDFITLVNAALK